MMNTLKIKYKKSFKKDNGEIKKMVSISNLLIGIVFGFFAKVLTFFQLQGQLKFDWFKDHYWLTVLMGILI